MENNSPNVTDTKGEEPMHSFFSEIPQKSETVLSFIQKNNPLASQAENSKSLLDYLNEIKESTFTAEKAKYAKSHKCRGIIKTVFNDKSVTSIIQNPKEMKKGYFDNFVLYEIKTEQFNWAVTRRYSDFIWLYQCLNAAYPGELLPQLPKKKIGNRRFEEDFVEKRMKQLQLFLNELLKNEFYKSSEVLGLFLSCKDRNYFENAMKEKTPASLAITSVDQINSFQGTTETIDFENENINTKDFNYMYYLNMNNYFIAQEETLNTLTKNLKYFYENMANAMINLKEVETNFNTLKIINTKTTNSPGIVNAYNQFFEFFKNWKRTLVEETCIVKEHILDFFKDLKMQTVSFSELLVKQDNLTYEYLSKKKKLMTKKESLWKTGDSTKWEILSTTEVDKAKLTQDKAYALTKMCGAETQSLENMFHMLGYHYCNNANTFWALSHIFEFLLVNKMGEFSSAMEPTINQLVTVWSHFTSSIKD